MRLDVTGFREYLNAMKHSIEITFIGTDIRDIHDDWSALKSNYLKFLYKIKYTSP